MTKEERTYYSGVADALESVAKSYEAKVSEINETGPTSIMFANQYRITAHFWREQAKKIKESMSDV